MTLTFVVPDRPASELSGGDRYDAALVEQWRRLGRPVEVVRVAGDWPWPTSAQVAALGRLLEEGGTPCGGGDGSAAPVLVDGLVGCAAPEAVERSAAVRPTALLIHSLLAEGAGATGDDAAELDRRERRALAAAHAVIAVSEWGRRQLVERHGTREVGVAIPGVGRAAVAPGSAAGEPPQLLCLGAVTPLKNHGLLLIALDRVADLPWTAVVAGPAPDTAYLRHLVAEAAARGLGDRVSWPGLLVGDDLEEVWSRTDLLVHPSRSESYGLVVAEAHAHGIPAVVGAGTGAVEALAGEDAPAAGRADGAGGMRPGPVPGAVVATDDPDKLTAVLRRWLTDGSLREQWRDAALARRNRLGGWDRTVEQIDHILDRITT